MLLEVQAMKCTLLRLGKDISICLLNLLDAQGEGMHNVYDFCRFDFVSNSQTAEILFSDHSPPRLSVHYQRKFNPLSAEK